VQTVDLSRFDNSWYRPGGSIRRLLWYYTNCIFFISPLCPVNKAKILLLKLFGAKIGKRLIIKPGVNIKYPWLLEIGDNVWIGERVWIDNLGKLKIGNNVCISQGAMLLFGNHDYKKSTFDLVVKEIVLEDGVWIGAMSVVCPGITMHSHSIAAAGSVVTKDTEAFTIYQGNPAVPVRERQIKN
jgi:putative colanic acid biosynthesis acetyltransferase WcaF